MFCYCFVIETSFVVHLYMSGDTAGMRVHFSIMFLLKYMH